MIPTKAVIQGGIFTTIRNGTSSTIYDCICENTLQTTGRRRQGEDPTGFVFGLDDGQPWRGLRGRLGIWPMPHEYVTLKIAFEAGITLG